MRHTLLLIRFCVCHQTSRVMEMKTSVDLCHVIFLYVHVSYIVYLCICCTTAERMNLLLRIKCHSQIEREGRGEKELGVAGFGTAAHNCHIASIAL